MGTTPRHHPRLRGRRHAPRHPHRKDYTPQHTGNHHTRHGSNAPPTTPTPPPPPKTTTTRANRPHQPTRHPTQRFRVWSPSARWTVGSLETDDRSAIHEAISLTLDSWQDHVAPLVSRVQTVPALRRLVQPAENKSHSVGCRWRGSLLWNGSLLWERYLVAEE